MVLIIVSAIMLAARWNEQSNIDGDSYDNRNEYVNSWGVEEKGKETKTIERKNTINEGDQRAAKDNARGQEAWNDRFIFPNKLSLE